MIAIVFGLVVLFVLALWLMLGILDSVALAIHDARKRRARERGR